MESAPIRCVSMFYIWQFLGISKRHVFRKHCAGLGPSFVRLFMPITKFNDVSSTLWLICEKSINSSSTQQVRLTQVLYNLSSLSQVNSNGLIISTEPTIVARTRVWAHCTKTTPFRRSKLSPRSLVGFRRSLPNSLNSTLIRIRNGFVL